MEKSDQTVKYFVVAAIRRHSIEMTAWSGTHLWDDTHKLDKSLLTHLSLEKGELPILYSFVDQSNWTMFTSRAVVFLHQGVHARVLLSEISDVSAGNFKGHGRQSTELLSLKTADGIIHKCPYRTGHESIGTLYAIKTLLQTRSASVQRD